jgi:hypothetical protein
VQERLIYGNKAKNPKEFDGFATRYNKVSTDKTSIGGYVLDGGGTGNTNTSIWFITWGDSCSHAVYPKGSKAGISHQNLGEVTVDGEDGKYQAYRDHFKWDIGLSVRDFRANCRIANIDTEELDGTNAADLIKLMVKGWHKIKRHVKKGRTVIYVNETIETALHIQAMEKKNVNLTIQEFAGKPVVMFLGIPIRCVEAILDTEEKVV